MRAVRILLSSQDDDTRVTLKGLYFRHFIRQGGQNLQGEPVFV